MSAQRKCASAVLGCLAVIAAAFTATCFYEAAWRTGQIQSNWVATGFITTLVTVFLGVGAAWMATP